MPFSVDFDANLKRDFGAKGNGTADDTQSVLDWKQYILETGCVGTMPKGDYLFDGRFLMDAKDAPQRRMPKIIGAGAYLSRLIMTTQEDNAVHFYNTLPPEGAPDFFFLTLEGVGFQGDTPNTFVTVGFNDWSDCGGDIRMTDVYFGNTNSTGAHTARTLKLNWVFKSKFENLVAVGRNWKGVAIEATRLCYSSFDTVSASNAEAGILLSGLHPSCANTFSTLNVENCLRAVISLNGSNYANSFIGGYGDLYNPDSGQISPHYFYQSIGYHRPDAYKVVSAPGLSRGAGVVDPSNRAGISGI